MMNKVFSAVSIGALIMSAACSSESSNTSPFAARAAARITGVVTDKFGSPLDSVQVFVTTPLTDEIGYVASAALTNSSGHYVIDVLRMKQLGAAPNPDTVRVDISVVQYVHAGPVGAVLKFTQTLNLSTNISQPITKELNFQLDNK